MFLILWLTGEKVWHKKYGLEGRNQKNFESCLEEKKDVEKFAGSSPRMKKGFCEL